MLFISSGFWVSEWPGQCRPRQSITNRDCIGSVKSSIRATEMQVAIGVAETTGIVTDWHNCMPGDNRVSVIVCAWQQQQQQDGMMAVCCCVYCWLTLASCCVHCWFRFTIIVAFRCLRDCIETSIKSHPSHSVANVAGYLFGIPPTFHNYLNVSIICNVSQVTLSSHSCMSCMPFALPCHKNRLLRRMEHQWSRQSFAALFPNGIESEVLQRLEVPLSDARKQAEILFLSDPIGFVSCILGVPCWIGGIESVLLYSL